MIKVTHQVLLGEFGDFNSIMTVENTGLDFYVWALFFLCTLILVIIMLNLLIAFINDSYENLVTTKQIAFAYERVQLIAAIEQSMTPEEIEELDARYKNQYLFIFRETFVQQESTQFESQRIRKKLDSLNSKIGKLDEKLLRLQDSLNFENKTPFKEGLEKQFYDIQHEISNCIAKIIRIKK
eukprot:TRINITY_DN14453_c0_g1_i3.p2 TRINITY_DN14453_c0_g1~~TRINITY_DN14453_c0_g1_i3.p2  ORF type:complete len:182 (-),score=29.22 TRINITY_DN14453_c0_g1_i3:60-605(-)